MNRTFLIVVREKDFKPFEKRPNRDAWGWELVDGIEIDDYIKAKQAMIDYSTAMPSHVVRLRILYHSFSWR